MTLTEILLTVSLATAVSAGTIAMANRANTSVETYSDIHKQAETYEIDAMKLAFGPDYDPANPTGQPQ